MQKHAYIFIGHSGAGKGTQRALLEERIRTQHPDEATLTIETGALFRAFIESGSYTAQETKRLMDEGKLPPPFIGIHVWSHELIARYAGERFVLLDGTPRVGAEVPVILSAAAFYRWTVHVVYLEVSDGWANERLIGRGRADDQDVGERAERTRWFHTTVVPALALLQAAPGVQFETINGERTIEEIHADICEKFGL